MAAARQALQLRRYELPPPPPPFPPKRARPSALHLVQHTEIRGVSLIISPLGLAAGQADAAVAALREQERGATKQRAGAPLCSAPPVWPA